MRGHSTEGNVLDGGRGREGGEGWNGRAGDRKESMQ